MELNYEEDADIFEPLDKPGDLEKAILHGQVQKALFVDDSFKQNFGN
jgi:hypothetical protein